MLAVTTDPDIFALEGKPQLLLLFRELPKRHDPLGEGHILKKKSAFKKTSCKRLRDLEYDNVWYRFSTLNRGSWCSSVSSARKLPSGKLTQWVLTSIFFGYSAGLKSPTVTSHNMAKTASQSTTKTAPTANQLAKQVSQYPLQRSGSARFSRVHSAGKDV